MLNPVWFSFYQLKKSKRQNKVVNKRLVSRLRLVSSSLLVCLCSSQGHGLWPISRPRLHCVLYMERVDGGVCGRGCVEGGYNSRADMSVSQRPAGDWPLLPRRPLTPVETVPLQVAAGSLWKHLGPAWVIGHMGDSAIQEPPTVPGAGCGRHEWEAWQPPPTPIFQSSCCPNTTTRCNLQILRRDFPHSLHSHTANTCKHTRSTFVSFLISKFVQLYLFSLIKKNYCTC